ncbi:hypothetical protein RAN3_2487 [plant metagenome]|uniref:Uncharacterized protein n=1 Tax=plant metagenome TaxID=1297885 RepID=A0A484U3J4_9ZZZZ
MRRFGCEADDAERYLDLVEEGHSSYHAAVMSGLMDPQEANDD